MTSLISESEMKMLINFVLLVWVGLLTANKLGFEYISIQKMSVFYIILRFKNWMFFLSDFEFEQCKITRIEV